MLIEQVNVNNAKRDTITFFCLIQTEASFHFLYRNYLMTRISNFIIYLLTVNKSNKKTKTNNKLIEHTCSTLSVSI